MYVSRERKIQKFSGSRKADEDTVENFVDNVKSLISARKMTQIEQADFVLSLLEKSAKEEVKLRPTAERDTSDKICNILLEAFGERRTTPQLLKSFYERKQKDTETLREFSHALCEIYNRIYSRDTTIIPSRDQALRDQFADNVRDPLLRKELKCMVRSNSSSKFLEVREEALHWAEEDERCVLQKEMCQVKQFQPHSQTKRWIKYCKPSKSNVSRLIICPKPLFPFPNPTIIFSGIREEEAAETPPSAALTKEGTEFVLNAKESDTLQEIV